MTKIGICYQCDVVIIDPTSNHCPICYGLFEAKTIQPNSVVGSRDGEPPLLVEPTIVEPEVVQQHL